MKLLKLLIISFPLVALAAEESLDPYKSKLEALKANPSSKVFIQGGWTVVEESGGSTPTIWSFTPQNHPAHPAFAKRTISQSDAGEWFVTTNLSCGGPESECKKLSLEFQSLDENMKAAINAEYGS